MKIGIAYTNAGPFGAPETAAALAEACEANGVESVWTVEHVVVPVGYESPYPYSDTGKMPAGEDVPISDPLVWLGWMAAKTSTVKLATGILILPQRNPLVTAKEVATLDVMSGGRVILGIGVGWLREEFDALGVPFEGRGKRTDEYVEALRTVWRDDEASFVGETVSFAPLKSFPKPIARSVPIVIGGNSIAAAKRAARIGDGFFPGGGEDGVSMIPVMREEAARLGRNPDEIEVTVGGKPDAKWMARVADEFGVSRVILNPPTFLPEQMGSAMRDLMERVTG